MFVTPELFSIYQKVAEEYDLPAFVGVNLVSMFPHLMELLSSVTIPVNAFMFMSSEEGADGWSEGYERMIANFQPGINVMLVHLSYDNSEMRAIAAGQEDFGPEWRQNDLDYLMSKEFRYHLGKYDIIPITWREVYEAFISQKQTH